MVGQFLAGLSLFVFAAILFPSAQSFVLLGRLVLAFLVRITSFPINGRPKTYYGCDYMYRHR